MSDENIVVENAVISSPIDDRDYTLDMLMSTSEITLPSSYRTKTTVPVFSQGSTGCCVACSLAACRYIQEELQEGFAKQFSVNYIYGNRLPTDSQNEGMIPRQALKTLLDYGDCHWSDFSGYASTFSSAKTKYNNNKGTYDDLAYPYKINSYYRLYNVEEIKTAVYQLGCAVIAYDMMKSLYSPDSKGYITYNSSDAVLGGHMLTIIGWTDDDHWIALNSWGTDYGINGYCYMPFDFPYSEAWTMVDNNRYQELTLERQMEKVSGIFFGIKKKRYLV